MITAMAARPSADDRWTAVATRAASADGQFVYAVTSTGIYCRPSCPSRRPRPDRVRFYPTPAAAEADGFRACKRCHPRDAHTPAERAVARARVWIDAHPEVRPSLDRLARLTGMSPWHLQRIFTRTVGLSPRQYARARQTASLKRQLRQTSVTDAIYAAGFGSPSRVYEEAAMGLGMTPGAYRRGGRGQHITFATARTPVGVMLAAATARGLCKVSIGDDEAEVESALRAEFPDAVIARDTGGMRRIMTLLRQELAGEPLDAAIPVDVAATAFQHRVWKALQAIPRGETRTYAEVAAAIGRPSAARAVARACASNPTALVVPCHRVVPSAGGTGGYRWGSERKKKLLAREAGFPPR
jgi:AraC family transcriptional regulator, regulatory protein of adaptative response / methylated-DNA-[protein]-cysteine methyltransferase